MNPPLNGVSVIVPVYNREKYLKECLDSVLAQEYDGPLEIVVCDDGSTDKTLEIADSYGPPVVVLRKPEGCKDQGPAPTRNRGIAASQYPYIAFLDSDDIFLPGYLKRLVEALEQNPQYPAAIDLLYWASESLSHRWPNDCPDGNELQLEYFFSVNYCQSLNSAVFRKSFLDSLDFVFDGEMLMAEDTDLYLRTLERHSILLIHEGGAVAREHQGRSVKNLRRGCSFSQLAFEKAIKRYPYPRWLIRKARARMAFRYAKIDMTEKKIRGVLWNLLKAFYYDPVRSLQFVLKAEFLKKGAFHN